MVGGRPKAVINWDTVEKLCAIQCTGEEIAAVLKIDYDTLNTHIKDEFNLSFSDYFKKHSAKGRMSLRRKQHEVALSGNATMLIWLGKQYLEQKDKQEVVSNITMNNSLDDFYADIESESKP